MQGQQSLPRVTYSEKRKIFGEASSYFSKRGKRVVSSVPDFYYATKNLMVCPPLDALEATEMFSLDP